MKSGRLSVMILVVLGAACSMVQSTRVVEFTPLRNAHARESLLPVDADHRPRGGDRDYDGGGVCQFGERWLFHWHRREPPSAYGHDARNRLPQRVVPEVSEWRPSCRKTEGHHPERATRE